MDITKHIGAKSDQLNAADLLGGGITVQITKVREGNSDQPVIVSITGGHRDWKPCKTCLRILVAAWGGDSTVYLGRWLTLYRDPTVLWAGKPEGGIRIRAMSDIPKPMTMLLAVTRGKTAQHRIKVLKSPKQEGAPTADLAALLADAGLTTDDVDRWREAKSMPLLSTLDDEKKAGLAGWLAADPQRIEKIRALIPNDSE